MNPRILDLLQCPVGRCALTLEDAVYNAQGGIENGVLVGVKPPFARYEIKAEIPRFVPQEGPASAQSVAAFGDQWNHYNFKEFKENFALSMANTFGNIANWKGKVVVDAGAGAGMQSRWFAEAGAKQVLALELSHAVDGVIKENLKGLANVQVIQCSIDTIPLKDEVIEGLVLCHNVIQHTPSVPQTLKELWRIAKPGSEVAFNCYTRMETTALHRLRFAVYSAVRRGVAACPTPVRRLYAHVMSVLRFIPVVGVLLEKADLVRRGPVVGLKGLAWIRFAYKAGVLNTYDYFGAHAYQHHHSFAELKSMVAELRPMAKPLNENAFYQAPQPSGIALRLQR